MDRQNDSHRFRDESTIDPSKVKITKDELNRLRMMEKEFNKRMEKIQNMLTQFSSDQEKTLDPLKSELRRKLENVLAQKEKQIQSENADLVQLGHKTAQNLIDVVKKWHQEYKKCLEARNRENLCSLAKYKDKIERQIDILSTSQYKTYEDVKAQIEEDPTYIKNLDYRMNEFNKEIEATKAKVDRMIISEEILLNTDVVNEFDLLKNLQEADLVSALVPAKAGPKGRGPRNPLEAYQLDDDLESNPNYLTRPFRGQKEEISFEDKKRNPSHQNPKNVPSNILRTDPSTFSNPFDGDDDDLDMRQ